MEGTICDNKAEIIVYLEESSIRVALDSIVECKTAVQMDRIEIGFGSEKEIIFIRIKDLKKEEYDELKDSLKL